MFLFILGVTFLVSDCFKMQGPTMGKASLKKAASGCSHMTSHQSDGTRITRRSALVGAAAGFGSAAAVLADGAPPEGAVTRMDAFQLKASYSGLDDALHAWRVEIAQVQLGSEPSSVVAVAGLSDASLQHFAQSGSGAQVESFKKRRDAMLSLLFLARGAARYEKDARVAEGYIDKAKVEAEGALSDLGAMATANSVELARPNSGAAAAPEKAVVFQPRSAPKVENRLVF